MTYNPFSQQSSTPENPKMQDSEGGQDDRIVTKIPGPEAPLIVKFVADPLSDKGYRPFSEYSFRVGPNPKDVRKRVSLASLGKMDVDLENEKRWIYIKKLSAMNKEGVSKEDPVRKQISELLKNFDPKKAGWVFFVEPGSPTIKALKAGASLLDSIFGAEADRNKPAVEGLLSKLIKKGKSPFNLKQDDCWLKIWKEGEGINTRYFAVPSVTTAIKIVDGEEVEVTRFDTFKVNPEMNREYESKAHFASFLPDVNGFSEKYNTFSVAETKEFVDTDGVVFPPRFAPKQKNSQKDHESTPVSHESMQINEDNLDDIPF